MARRATARQLRARKIFAARAKSGAFRKRASSPRKRKVARRARTVKSVARRSRGRKFASRIGGKKSAIVDGVIAGAAGNLVNLGTPLGNSLVLAGVGYWRKNETLQTIAGVSLGQQLLSGGIGGILGGGNNATGSGRVL